MAIRQPVKARTKTISIPVEAARLWKEGKPIPDPIKRFIEEQIEEKTSEAIDVYEQERRNIFMGKYKGNVSELLYAVVGFLTTRKQPLIFSAKHNAAPIAEIMGAIVKANGLPETTENWPHIVVPEGTDDLTNEPTNFVAPPPPTPEHALSQLMAVIKDMSVQDQNVTIASFLDCVKEKRTEKLRLANQTALFYQLESEKAERAVDGLNRIATGDYFTLVITPKGPDSNA